MDWITLMETLGEQHLLAGGGLLIGLFFGYLAQRSRFCLRSAVIEVSRGVLGVKLAVWLFAFSAALVASQAMMLSGNLDVSSARQLTARGSLSGAAIGGLLFGIGMVLARGCASRLLVLAANGNLRALLSGLVFAVTAQSALDGALAPLREAISSWWTIEGTARDMLAWVGAGHLGGLVFGVAWLALAVALAIRHRLSLWGWLGSIGVGLMVAAGWWFTFQMSVRAFEPIGVQSLSFTGPSAGLLMRVLTPPDQTWNFDLGLVPGVFLGSFIAAWMARELKLEGFQGGASMRRYIAGALCMGMGGMLAGGCAVGAGVSGAAVFTVTAWVTLASMWLGAGLTDWLVDRRGLADADPATPSLPMVGLEPVPETPT
ncbi:MAG: YeeE/YedE family protein [Rhodocyclaceae bacterium]|nr:YeeE/YedE family protein [Rhodocyclaceae bacterium]